MKRIFKFFIPGALIVGLLSICSTTTSCSSSNTMYQSNTKKTSVVNKNYKVKGNKKKNKATYRSY